MIRKICSIVYPVTGFFIGLGSLGHASNAGLLTAEFAKFPTMDAQLASVILAVWYFCSGCMIVFGAILTRIWWRQWRGEIVSFFASDIIALFYIVVGPATVAYTGKPFFWLFFALGTVLLLSSIPLRRQG